MPPANNTFGGGATETVLGTGVLVLMLIVAAIVLFAPRRFILSPLLVGLLLVPSGQTLVIGSVHVTVTRILVLVGILRVVSARRVDKYVLGMGLNSIDKIFVLWMIFRSVAFVLRYQQAGAAIKECGTLWDALGGYFLFRALIRDDADIWRVVKTLAAIVSFLGITMFYEHWTRVNVYGWIAGHTITPEMRSGSVRAQGPFHHAILAGVFAATSLPLFLWLMKSGKAKLLGLAGCIGSTLTVFCAGSSTSVSAYIAGFIAMAFWPLRNNMRMIRWGLVAGVIVLNFAMHAPVWWALEHIDFAGGSAGEHRAELIDNLVRHFGDWWIIGTSDNSSWGFEMWDLSNQYIDEAESGGLVSLVCLITVITLAYKWIGISRKSVRKDRHKEWSFWFLGAALFSHTVAFFGISYFDQSHFAWYALLAIIPVATMATLTVQYFTSAPGEPSTVPLVASPCAPLDSFPSNSFGKSWD